MALNASTLEQLIMTKLEDNGLDTSNEFFQGDKYARAIAEAVVEHIKSAAVVNTTVPAAGIIDGEGVPCTGQAAGTGTVS